MAGRSKVAQEAFDIAEPIVKALGFDLVDCEYKKEGQYYFLRIFIDKRGGIGIDDCEIVSREVDKALEGKLHADPDYFEVSSPGATRPFSSLSDYVRHQGEEIEVSLFSAIDGSKHHGRKTGLGHRKREDRAGVGQDRKSTENNTVLIGNKRDKGESL